MPAEYVKMNEPESTQDFRIRRALVQRLESLQRAGVEQIARVRVEPPVSQPLSPEGRIEEDAACAEREQATKETTQPLDKAMPSTKDSAETRLAELKVLKDEVAGCTLCGELARSRTQTVFGVGNPDARLCFFGEAPGADEDRQGEPFVGRAGKLLTDIIEKGMGLRREDVYILNVLKCRPPGNRNPLPDEVENCQHFFERQLELIQPEFICCLGAVAAQNLLGTNEAIGRLRGRFHDYRGIKVVATYHPAYLLRNPSAKKNTWGDIKMLMGEMGMEAPEQ